MNTYRVAVCDDEDAILDNLCSLCREILTEDGISNEITAFSNTKDLKEKLDTEIDPFDLLVLDIKMEGMTGMELARSLRNNGNYISIVFITACDEYLSEGYDVQPIHFLLKPITKDRFCNALRADLKLNYLPKTALLHIGSKTVRLSLADIQYMESFNHDVIIHQGGRKRTYSCSLTELERQLPSGQFCRCHNSYLVNLEYVQEIGRTELYLRSNETLPVGRTYYKSFQGTFIRYINQ